MSDYLIDHDIKKIHRTRFINDKCSHKCIVETKREFLSNKEYVNRLVYEQCYAYCSFCKDAFF
ncbi:hypothetical protein DH09_00055 (plasmid) [Bacillaceae bacterium JMAK1]|nr:hypothetical protein DH09_00055 [Bacillaceae bacterium JMAK1]